MKIAHIRHTLANALDDFKSKGGSATQVLSAIEALVEEKMMPIKERPSFSEWTSDHVRDNLHKLNPQPLQQDIPDLIAGALGVSRGTAYDMMRAALAEAQPQPEPVAWMSDRAVGFRKSEFGATPTVPLYTSPPARKPLTDQEIRAIVREVDKEEGHIIHFARAIEAAHGIKEKNT